MGGGDARHGPAYWDDPATVDAWLAGPQGWRSPVETMEEPMFRRLVGDVGGLRVLDVGCGDGRLAEVLLAAGAAGYHGIDPSRPLLALARPAERATFEAGSIETLAVADASFDLVVARLVLHYVADLGAAIARLAAALAPAGALVYTVEHPVITSHESTLSRDADGFRTRWVVDDYFDAGGRQLAWINGPVVKYHRPLEDHVRALTAAGLQLEALEEGRPEEGRFAGQRAEYERRRRIPLFLGVRARAGGLRRPDVEDEPPVGARRDDADRRRQG